MRLGQLAENEMRPYICVHATKGKHECHADSSYGAAKKAAAHWKLKSTAGIDTHLADVEKVAEAGGYYTQPVYDMIEKYGYEKVMHELLTSLHADAIQSFLQRANFDEAYSPDDEVKEADETKYGIVRYPDTAISYIKNDGNGWEHIFDKSYGFEGPVDKADLQYAKKIDKEKIPSRMFGMNEAEKRWKQTSMSPAEAEKEYGKENVKVKKGALRNGDDMVEVFVESQQMMTEAQFDEAAGEKDACYRKVKARYKVWPSAYASGALTKCRKVGAANWGNSKK